MAGNVSGGLVWLDAGVAEPVFPDPESAMSEPNGLLAAGGSLTSNYLLKAYSAGIFPWYDDGQPLLWWSPDPRAVIDCGSIHISHSLRRILRHGAYEISIDQDCAAVIAACAKPRQSGQGTWITTQMEQAYLRMHRLGHVHSVEIWDGEKLVGGLYGVAMGAVFCGESMFSIESNASKVAMACLDRLLADAGFAMIDCQLETPHLRSMGAMTVPRHDYLIRLKKQVDVTVAKPPWPMTRCAVNKIWINHRL